LQKNYREHWKKIKTAKILKCVVDVLKTFCFSLLKADKQANACFFTVHSHELITVKILGFNPKHFDLLVTNSNMLNSSITGVNMIMALMYIESNI
jgi:hypothetical protein